MANMWIVLLGAYLIAFIGRQNCRNTKQLTSQNLLYMGGANKISKIGPCKTTEYSS